jgi:hypothetical protein
MAEQFSPEYVSGLKQKFDHIQAEARKEVRRKKREEVGEVKKRMYDKLEVLSDKISALYSAVYHEPDKLTLETAQGFVLNDSKPYLTEGEAKSLRTAIERYHEKRKAVKEFIKSTRSQEEAFFLCFGFYPTGKMEVISGPMTLTFRLYDFEDFKKAYLTAYVKSGKDEIKKISDQAEGVGGVAMRDAGGWVAGKDIETYLRYLYILTPDNRIEKYERLSNRYGPASPYNVSGDLTGSIDMVIDGNVFVLKEKGKVVKLFRGEAQPFSMHNVPEGALDGVTKFTKLPNGNFYFLDPSKKQVLVATDGGSTGESTYVRQYVFEGEIGNLKDLYVDPDETHLYIMDEQRVYVADIVKK